MLEDFKKGSGGRYLWDEKNHRLIKISDTARDSNYGFNGPVWFPKGGTKYFDKALNRWFYSKEEKKQFMRKNHLVMQGMDREGDLNSPEAGLGKRRYFYGR